MSAVPQQPAANDPDELETREWLDALERDSIARAPSARIFCSGS
jgi:hypothetical protein